MIKDVEELVGFTTALQEPLSGTLRMGPYQSWVHICRRASCLVCAKQIPTSSSIWSRI